LLGKCEFASADVVSLFFVDLAHWFTFLIGPCYCTS
jgi:hypothetical protein